MAAQPPSPALATPDLAAAPTAQSPASVLLTRVDPACNMHRFYSLALSISLFGKYGVVRQWGRIGTTGQSRTDWYGGAKDAESALQALLTTKQRRGYSA